MEQPWDDTYTGVVLKGYELKDMPSSNMVWDAYLRDHEFTRNVIPNSCPHCYTVRQFADDNPEGTYILATGSHVVTVRDGDYYDSWDSGSEVPIYYYVKEEK